MVAMDCDSSSLAHRSDGGKHRLPGHALGNPRGSSRSRVCVHGQVRHVARPVAGQNALTQGCQILEALSRNGQVPFHPHVPSH